MKEIHPGFYGLGFVACVYLLMVMVFLLMGTLPRENFNPCDQTSSQSDETAK